MPEKQTSKEFLELEGVVEESLPSTVFKVRLDNGRTISAYLSGKMRINKIKVLPGDKVRIEISPYDTTKGRIVYRYK
ncbi:translation initiation factor IF-1 [bacterium (Candidatus Moisslbacteria) CG12_big_fil_rev_8_21_14_0_65_36_11]|nr:translation initiation factor IF-1 [Candidatus Kuenenbacteria bacterium]OIP76625.1 MAG: translation initiation factor IF-1 [Parcubacteria group bacterium CG2_30_36_38]PIV46136.1 MAG: translation initiation factor IF-1 [bacterium (Candidatus Moisslbacteria) CG02_land_8_20_14_3_00_36_53]PIW67695.1 MAG: translation initiation factor IF-1 [bacterium (Candidatus Moisslbacteria) CG12_big_fil_rev_8_21_14_0_65_36_11]PIZ90355.1 MAG: translation initiation factor IF-1 [bacterium (Candidatus Moisslbact